MATRIMVVNDTQEILELFDEILTGEGYEVVLYSYAIMDMQEVDRAKPDLIILDYIFGTEKTGWQMLQKLKMRPQTAAIPVIVCTAATREVREIEGYLRAKGVGLVPKPFNLDDLVAAVRWALASHDRMPGATPEAQESLTEAESAPSHDQRGEQPRGRKRTNDKDHDTGTEPVGCG